MPKQPPVEYFKLSYVIAKPDLGEEVAGLIRRGRTDIHYDLVTDVPAFAQRKNHEVKSEDFLAAWVVDHPTFKAIEVVKYFEANGRTKGAAYPTLGVLVEKGVLKKLGPGDYSRADVKHLAAPKKKAKTAKTAKTARRAVSNAEFLLRHARRKHGRFSSAYLKHQFEKDGRTTTSVGPCLNELMNDRKIKRVGDGEYVLLAKATPPEVKSPEVKSTEPKPGNSNAAEVTHG